MTWPIEDDNRLDAFRRGEDAVLTEIYRLYATNLRRFFAGGLRGNVAGSAFKVVPAEDELDDIVQEMFLRVFFTTTRNRYDGTRPFVTYLGAIARNLVIDRFRARSRSNEVRMSLSHELSVECLVRARRSTPEVEAFHREVRYHYEWFLTELPERDRTLCAMRFQGGASRRETGRVTGYSLSEIRTREKRIREQVANALGFLALAETNSTEAG